MLLRKAKRKANLEYAQQHLKEAIESILLDSKRVLVRGGFKSYADTLAECYQSLLKSINIVIENGVISNCTNYYSSAKSCANSISSIVVAANSAAAICTNKAIQNEIVVRTIDIAVETANLLGYFTTSSHTSEENSRMKMQECIESIQDQVQQILELLAAAGRHQQELDDSKIKIERAAASSSKSQMMITSPQLRSELNVKACVDIISDRAKVLSTAIKNFSNNNNNSSNGCISPERVAQFSKLVAHLMSEILDATTNIIPAAHNNNNNNGVDIYDPEFLAGIYDISVQVVLFEDM